MRLKRKVLVVTAKWPFTTKSTDGGDSTTKEIIHSLKSDYIVDLLCFRDDIDEHSTIDGVNKIFVYYDDFALFKNYSLHNEEKFLVRLSQAEIAKKEIKKLYQYYDFIIVQHAMFILAMEGEKRLLDKIVLFPMFTGSSYLKSGELVPAIYIKKEKNVLSNVKLIISPSNVEKEMLVNYYGVYKDKILVVPRPVEFTNQTRSIRSIKEIKLLYIASVRLQKNHLDALRLVKIIIGKGVKAELHCVGAIQDDKIYKECIAYMKENELSKYVFFHGNSSRNQLEKTMGECDYNISVSQWETFGRGIYEGMVFGLPTIVLNTLECVMKADNLGVFPCIVSSLDEMANAIVEMHFNYEKYKEESKKGKELSELLSKENSERIIQEKLKEVFFSGVL